MGTQAEIKRRLDQLVAKSKQVSDAVGTGEMGLAVSALSEESSTFMPD